MRPRLLRAADRAAVPWKNGGGVTREVAAFPSGAAMADFGWRVSIAEVATAGPFSSFPGIDRILTVLDGTLDLHFPDDDRRVTLRPGTPHTFPGDIPVTGTPAGGPVRDLNIMVRRGRWRADIALRASRVEPSPGAATMLLVATGRCTIGGIALGTFDALLAEPPEPLDVAGAPAWQIDLIDLRR